MASKTVKITLWGLLAVLLAWFAMMWKSANDQ